MINYFEISDAIELHNSVIDVSGGSCGVNDINLLSSALTHIQNDDYYPEFIDKLTHLMFACIKFILLKM